MYRINHERKMIYFSVSYRRYQRSEIQQQSRKNFSDCFGRNSRKTDFKGKCKNDKRKNIFHLIRPIRAFGKAPHKCTDHKCREIGQDAPHVSVGCDSFKQHIFRGTKNIYCKSDCNGCTPSDFLFEKTSKSIGDKSVQKNST